MVNATSRILLVEDDAFIAQMLVDRLSKDGYDVVHAADGDEGVELAITKPSGDGFAIILLDLLLPKLDGFGVLERLKADARTASIPVLILSNLGDAKEIQHSLSLGAIGYMVKAEHTPDEIALKIREILAKPSQATAEVPS